MFFTKVLWEGDSKFNKNIKVIKSFGLGTYIQVNDLTQSGGIVESIWKQTLKKLNSKKLNAKSFLILGLGGGTVAKLLRRKYPEAKITGIEIDPLMVELGTRYLGLATSTTEIVIQDARKFKFDKYDLVIVDCYIGDKAINLKGSDLLRSSVVIFNRLYYGKNKAEAEKFGKKLEKLFPRVEKFYPPANLIYICYNN